MDAYDKLVLRLATLAMGRELNDELDRAATRKTIGPAYTERWCAARAQIEADVATDRDRLRQGLRPLSLDGLFCRHGSRRAPDTVHGRVTAREILDARWTVAEADYALSVGRETLVPRANVEGS